MKAKIIADSGMAKGIVVSEIKDGETQIAWRGRPFSTLGTKPHPISISATLDIQVMLGNKMETKDRTIKIYLWNRDKTPFSIEEMEVSWRKANPYRYALFSDFTPE